MVLGMELTRCVILTGDSGAMSTFKDKTVEFRLGSVRLTSIAWGTDDEWVFIGSSNAGNAVVVRDGFVHVDVDVVARVDDAVHQMVALFTVAQRTTFSAACVSPVVGLIGADAELQPLAGLPLRGVTPAIAVARVHDQIELTPEIVSALADRPDGLQLLAEAIADQNLLGRYVQLLRLLEHAFGHPLGSFNPDLMDFLADTATRHRFTRQEISRWVESRPRVMHADRADKEIWYARDVARAVHRLQEAATDVLFNKAHWHQRDATRRACRVPRRGTIDTEAGMFITRGLDVQANATILDPFGSFPLFLNGDVASLVPAGLWATAIKEHLVLRHQGGPGSTASVLPHPQIPAADATIVDGAHIVVYSHDDDSSEWPS